MSERWAPSIAVAARAGARSCVSDVGYNAGGGVAIGVAAAVDTVVTTGRASGIGKSKAVGVTAPVFEGVGVVRGVGVLWGVAWSGGNSLMGIFPYFIVNLLG